MDFEQFSFKEFNNVHLKALNELNIGNRNIVPGETILLFDQIQIAGLNQASHQITAHGGYQDAPRVYWTSNDGLALTFSQGVFSHEQFALMSNSKLLDITTDYDIWLTNSEKLESDEHGVITLAHIPVDNLFVYEIETGMKLTDYTVDGQGITLDRPYVEVMVNYQWAYNSNATVINIGDELIGGFLELEGQTSIKDDQTGKITTGIIRIPKLKLASNMSLTLGQDARSPIVATFYGKGAPVSLNGASHCCEFYALSDDITSDL